MDEGAKRRLVGAAVLVALAVIFVPMLLDDKDTDGLGEPIVIPDEPPFDAGLDAGRDDSDTAFDGDRTPALPSPEAPSGVAGAGADIGGTGTTLPEPPPASATEPTQSRTSALDRSGREPADAAARPAATGPKPVPAGAAAWVVQVASLGSSTAAGKLQDELRGKGYPAFVEQATVNGKLYFRVRVGPETDRRRADNVAAKLQRETGNKPLVQTYR